MDSAFWLQKWENGETRFHESVPNPLLTQYFQTLSLPAGSRVLVPLCGKTLDIAWLLANGYRVVGVELAKIAIAQLFAALGVVPKITEQQPFLHYSAAQIDIFAGDIFEMSHAILGSVDGIYDRAALVALPEPARRRYTAHLMKVTGHAPQLLIGLEYDQKRMDGPPFSVGKAEISQHYAAVYDITLLSSKKQPELLKGTCEVTESAWTLTHGQRNP